MNPEANVAEKNIIYPNTTKASAADRSGACPGTARRAPQAFCISTPRRPSSQEGAEFHAPPGKWFQEGAEFHAPPGTPGSDGQHAEEKPWALELTEMRDLLNMQRQYLDDKLEKQREHFNAQLQKLADKLVDRDDRPATRSSWGDRDSNFARIEERVFVMQLDLAQLTSSTLKADDAVSMRAEMHNMVEAVAIKAGLLAVAVADADTASKRNIFDTLKAKEAALTNKAGGIVTFTSAAGRGGETLDGCADPPVEDGIREFEILIDRTDGRPLGLETDGSDGCTLLVLGIEKGVVHDWNRFCQPPRQPVQLGDQIVQVNAVRGSAGRLSRELQAHCKLRIRLRPGSEG